MLQQSGSFSDVIVTANYDWEVVPDQTATWLSVERNENKLTIGTDEPNHSGAERTATVIIRGTGKRHNYHSYHSHPARCDILR